MCNIDFELRFVPDGEPDRQSAGATLSASSSDSFPLLGAVRAYKFLLRGQNELDELGFGGGAAGSVKGLHLALPTMRVGETADIRLSPEYAFGSRGVVLRGGNGGGGLPPGRPWSSACC